VAGARERALRQRIRTDLSIRKTTHAMELIATARIARAQEALRRASIYEQHLAKVARQASRLAKEVPATAGTGLAKLVGPAEVESPVALVVVSSDRGLCGSYNSAILRLADHRISELMAGGRQVSVTSIGNKADGHLRRRQVALSGSQPLGSPAPGIGDALRFREAVLDPYLTGQVGQVQMVSTRFESLGRQRATVWNLLPLRPDEVAAPGDLPPGEIETEPDPAQLLAALVEPLGLARLWRALAEAALSAHVAQQRAMKAATDNADELVVQLKRELNRARQDSITTEIMDIVGGAEALR
jgi:F-type H+-transporting ATPase subunit gamma